MSRGTRRPTARREAVQRALDQLVMTPLGRPITYRLTERNGGRDPYADHCGDASYGGRVMTADCVGFVVHCSGLDRLQLTTDHDDDPATPEVAHSGSRGPWLNCAALIDDADGPRLWCEPVDYWQAEPGDWLVTPAHIGIILRPARRFTDDGATTAYDHLVADCSPRHGSPGVIGCGRPWSTACRVLRYRHYVGG